MNTEPQPEHRFETPQGKKPVPIVAYSYNGSAVDCARTTGARCILGANPAYLSAEALRLAVNVLDGQQAKRPRNIYLYTPT